MFLPRQVDWPQVPIFTGMNNTHSLLILFVKHPVAGQTKTRLAAGIGHEKALAAYHEMLLHLRTVAAATRFDVVVFYGNEIPDQDVWSETGWPRLLQAGETLGERMNGAFAWGKDQGYSQMVLVGSDIPGVDAELLQNGMGSLESHEVVIGPSTDGGYYLIGLRQPDNSLFEKIEWSTPTVLEQTRERIAEQQLSLFLLPALQDVDTIEDLPGTFLEHYLPSADSSES